MKVCIGLVILIMTIVSMILGIVAIIMTASVLGAIEDTDADAEAARIIVDALQTWDTNLISDIKVVDGVGCDQGWEHLFNQRWSGTDQGCWYEG